MPTPPQSPAHPHAQPVPAVAADLGTDPDTGLAPEEAARRLRAHGPNELPSQEAPGAWRILARQFRSVLIWILVAAIALSLALGELVDAAAIAAIAAFTVVLGFVQEQRAQVALDALRRISAPKATVVRGGEVLDVPAREVVPGDVFLVAQGDVVPADGRVVEASRLEASEASLTGESVPVHKDAAHVTDAAAPVGDRHGMLHASTHVTNGRGRAVAVATGVATQVGRIGRMVAGVEDQKTPLEKQLARLGHWLVWAAAAIVVLVVALGVARGLPLLEMLLFGVALAVAAVPEALPAVVTIALAVGARRMARRNALVRRLPAVETLGGTTVVCTDKTGTLTTGRMAVAALTVAGEGGWEVWDAGAERGPGPAVLDLLRAAALASDATVRRGEAGWEARGDPTEAALVVAAAEAGLDKDTLERDEPRIGEEPFTSERKRMTTLHRVDGGVVAYGKGALRAMLEVCTHVAAPGGPRPLDDDARAAVQEQERRLADRGMRVLAVATRRLGAPGPAREAEAEMTLLGLVGLRDPPRPEAQAAIRTCIAAGLHPIMVTGDHPGTARAIAMELGIPRADVVVDGRRIEAMDEAALADAAGEAGVFARVDPAHKLRLVTALQSRGHVVAMTGDGVNDAPALRKADIGVAMGITGTDVSKEAADMTLADDDFATIVAAVEEGRAIFDNVRKFVVYLLSTNLGELALIAATLVLGMPLPLSAVMILYVNLASDGLPALSLAVDPHDEDAMRRPPRRPGAGILDGPVITLMVLGGLWTAGAVLWVFRRALAAGTPSAEAMTMALACLVLLQFTMGFSFRTERHSLLRRPFANKWYNLAVTWEVTLLMLLVYLPPLNRVFGTAPLSAAQWAPVLVAVVTVVPVLEAAKWLSRRVAARRAAGGT